ncbi:hypothetical protein PV379_01250 [Streptomyces caniscabiei]|uniref:hypothetical protein n=1 Tax=Streptomyces caniscabiei TaxID=2746961 RepID=UPI0029B83A03|nr:hypothetical protein [Streptomyces caniscabiei]MDX2775980.1 hypothetical protein [Streptomyces caniscabiei]
MNKEIEARFLNIDKQKLISQLHAIGATDRGEVLLTETIFYDQAGKWHAQNRRGRVI